MQGLSPILGGGNLLIKTYTELRRILLSFHKVNPHKEEPYILPPAIMAIIRERLGDTFDDYLILPALFTAMQAEFIDFDLDRDTLTTRFPVLDQFRNPYGSMPGSIVARSLDL